MTLTPIHIDEIGRRLPSPQMEMKEIDHSGALPLPPNF
jgi:hypothetical protein